MSGFDAVHFVYDDASGLGETVELMLGIVLLALSCVALVAHVVVWAVEALLADTDDGTRTDVAVRVMNNVTGNRSGGGNRWASHDARRANRFFDRREVVLGSQVGEAAVVENRALVVRAHARLANVEIETVVALRCHISI